MAWWLLSGQGMKKVFSRPTFRWLAATRFRWLAATSVAATCAIVQPTAARQPRAHLDQALETAINNGARGARVIIRVNPGDRAALQDKLRGRGHNVKAEHGLISALTTDIPVD